MLRLCCFLLIILSTVSCKKAIERDLETEEDRMTGTWTVASLRHVVEDTLGNTLSDSTLNNQGTLNFSMASGEGADVFNPVLFEGGSESTELVSYFRGLTAGDATTSGGWALYWDADPAGKRLIIWGIAPNSSYHRTVNLEYEGNGKGERQMWYTITPYGMASQRHFYYFSLRR